MTASIPAYAPLVERVERGEALPAVVRQEHAVGMPEECAGRSWCSSPRTPPPA